MTQIILPDIKVLAPFMKDVEAICAPLKSIGVTFFNYLKVYKDGSRIDLNNNHIKPFEYYYYDSSDYNEQAVEWQPFKFKEKILLWSQFPDDKFWQVMRDDFNIAHGITFIEKSDEYCELFHFASERTNSNIIHYYINNIDCLKAFISYFKQNANIIINKADSYKIKIKSYQPISDDLNFLLRADCNDSHFLNKLRLNKFIINDKINGDFLTKREAQCLLYSVRGKSAKHIARCLNLSHRTVELYLATLKTKFQAANKYELIEKAISADILNKIPTSLLE